MNQIIRSLLKKEPAIIIGFIVSVSTGLADALASEPDVTTWYAATPLIVSYIIRNFVVSPNTAENIYEEAVQDGKLAAYQEVTEARSQAAKKGAAKKTETKVQTAAKTVTARRKSKPQKV